jgi:quercetin dioxygenase-like cupin family protein
VYAPGWKQGHGTYTHNYWCESTARRSPDSREEIFVVSGKVYDHTIKRWVYPGEYACRPPGQKHGPFECAADEGAVVLLINTPSWPKE